MYVQVVIRLLLCFGVYYNGVVTGSLVKERRTESRSNRNKSLWRKGNKPGRSGTWERSRTRYGGVYDKDGYAYGY